MPEMDCFPPAKIANLFSPSLLPSTPRYSLGARNPSMRFMPVWSITTKFENPVYTSSGKSILR